MSSIAEIHILGTGGGYGESILVNLGNQEWIVIDCCIDPITKQSLPLKFFIENNIDLGQIKYIICTHWHDDHIQGISTLFENCLNTEFTFGNVLDLPKFLNFVAKDYDKVMTNVSNSSTIEFNKCLEIAEKRKKTIRTCGIDRLLYTAKVQDIPLNIYSLSPSDLSVKNFNIQLSDYFNIASQSNVKLLNSKPNDKSVVILVQFGCHNVLFGADLEVKIEENLGWLDIINNSQVIKAVGKSSYFKIPHHGSQNGYHDQIWENLITKNPISTLTIWRKLKRLPDDHMIDVYKNLSNELYITSSLEGGKKPKNRGNKITKIINQNCKSIEEIKYYYGVISSNISIEDPNGTWNTNLAGTAICIKP